MDNIKSSIKLIIFYLIIPLIGITSSYFIAHGFERRFEKAVLENIKNEKGIDLSSNQEFLQEINLNNLCQKIDLDPGLKVACKIHLLINYLGYFSIINIGSFIAALFIIYILSQMAKRSRNALFYLFRPGLFLCQMTATILVITNAAILIFSIYLAESFYFGKIYASLMIILAFLGIYTAIIVCVKAFKLAKLSRGRITGRALIKNDFPKLWELVESIAQRIGVSPPTTIIVGIEPNFFLTESKIHCLDGEIRGKSLYLSLPFCRVLTKSELSAIIAHEMGYYIGENESWSRKFYPLYNRAIETYSTFEHSSPLKNDKDNQSWAQMTFTPALVLINLYVSLFAKAEKNIGIEREFNADVVAIKITSADVLAIALLKCHLCTDAWPLTQEKIREALTEEKKITNISTLFFATYNTLPPASLKEDIDKYSLSHRDWRPSLAMRLNAMGVELSTIYSENIKLPINDAAIELIENVTPLEEELSEAEYYNLLGLAASSTHEAMTEEAKNDAENK